MKTVPKETIYLLMCITSAVIERFSFAPFHYPVCALVALTVLLIAIGKTRHPFLFGWIYGSTKAALISFWLLETLTGQYGLSLPLSLFFYVATILIPAGLFPSITCKAIHSSLKQLHKSERASEILTLSVLTASVYTLIEWIRISFSPENSWGFIPATFSEIPEMMALAGITGGVGLLFILVLLSSLLASAAQHIKYPKKLFRVSAIAVVLFFIVFLSGHLIHSKSPKNISSSKLDIALIHPVINQKHRWNSSFDQQTLATYRRMSLRAFKNRNPENTRLIIWPETAITAGVQNSPLTAAVIKEITKNTGAWLLTGSPAFSGKGDNRKIYNSAFLYSPEGEIKDRYDKVALLPFAERKYALFSLGGFQESQLYEKGEHARPITIDTGKQSINLATLICFEVGIPGLSHNIISQQSNVIVNISNDAWFGNSSESQQQLDMLALRSAEYKIPAIRSTGYGVSAIINSDARIQALSEIDKQSIITGTVELRPYQPSLWARFPNWPVLIMAAIVVVYIVLRVYNKDKE